MEQSRDPKERFMNQKLDYEVDPDFQLIKYICSGVQVVLINDFNNIFYPVLTVNLANFEYKQVGEFGQYNGRCLVKAMLSYYNPSASEWEPLIEKVKIELMTNHYKGQIFHLISLKSDFNVNVSIELMQSLIQTSQELQKNIQDKPEAGGASQSSRESVRRTTKVSDLKDILPSYNRATGVSARPSTSIQTPRS